MPFAVRKQKCRQSDGTPGTHVVYRTDTGKKVSCHRSHTAAEAARRIRTARSEDRHYNPNDAIILIEDTNAQSEFRIKRLPQHLKH